MKFTSELKDEYSNLFSAAVINENKFQDVCVIVDSILLNQSRYFEIEKTINAPWQLIAAIHSLESSLSFKTHLHNGDPLTSKTTHVPKGRPKGNPPFTWIESALDALSLKKWYQWDDWSIEGCLFKAEEYNGFGYRLYHSEILSPYLWSFTNHYIKGKYASDGKFNRSLVSKQCGVVAILKILEM